MAYSPLTYQQLTSTTKPKTWQEQLDEMQKKEYAMPPELQKLQQIQTEQLGQRIGMQEKAQRQAYQNRLGITGLAGSGVGQQAMGQLEQQLGQQREQAYSQLRGEQTQAQLAAGEAARGREFQAMQSEADRGIQQQTLDFQKALGLGYQDDQGNWVRGSSQIANIELDESLRNDIINAMQALQKFKPGRADEVKKMLEDTYGVKRVWGDRPPPEYTFVYEPFGGWKRKKI